MLSNRDIEHWDKNCLDPHFCYDYMLTGRCAKMQSCYLRHIAPTSEELVSLRWYNPRLWETIAKRFRQRAAFDVCPYTKLFPSEEAVAAALPGYSKNAPALESKTEARNKVKIEPLFGGGFV
ncbi:hypothetical protein PtrSN002B_011331 [Pyrenophora tritici-repentis]|nr:hypothetical protein PtrV1_03810 [Pyrenophora tritici-repentis]KAF7451486.1 hypothetical protein A1F99_032630 [Pyrenophora tritici-repentis]KAG9385850.1 hypothetical protein A1F94_002600 [Pyrenophora tritici-repentis]KAI1523110.1 hypothetical protein PtrSN001C_011579 [Pyrenophora tritici-repentis]KAI1523671.1 hypothetical protein PtrSN001A_011209 [Pyrenophora tritici-repentis]